jgi:hypothetical protein
MTHYDEILLELRGFAPIGVLEQWNTGVMGELALN